MTTTALMTLGEELLTRARAASAGRAAELVAGGPGTTMTQTMIALRQGTELSEHANPGEATVLVLDGQVRVTWGAEHADGDRGDLLDVPDAPHGLKALADALVLLTAVKLPGA